MRDARWATVGRTHRVKRMPSSTRLFAHQAGPVPETARHDGSSYVMIGCGPEGAPHRPDSACGSAGRRHLPPAVRTLRQAKLQQVLATRTRPWAVLVRLLLGLPTTHQELLCWQAAAGRRGVDRRGIRRPRVGAAQVTGSSGLLTTGFLRATTPGRHLRAQILEQDRIVWNEVVAMNRVSLRR